MTLPELCIRRPVMTSLLMLSFVVIGFFGYRQLPVAALPNVDLPTISVSASLPGASPETMAASVATPLEKEFATIPGIDSISSTSSQGSTRITLQFDLDRDLDGASLDVQSALTIAARRLPEEMTTPPSFRKLNPADQPVLLIALTSTTLPLSAVDEYAETLIAQRLSTLLGVAQVQVYGAQKYAVRVQVDPNAVAAMGIGFDEIRNAVAAANSTTPVGTLSGPKRNLTLEASGQLSNAAAYRPLIVAYRNGSPVRLEDVAQVLDSVENDKQASWFNGERSILLAIQRQPDANTVEVVSSIRALLPELQAQLPASVHLNVMLDRSASIRASVENVQFTLALTVGLVVLVIFIFLRNVTATIIPALALPVSLVGTFAGMYLLGYSLDNLSLLALMLSVGFVVDDAIVMLENIVRHVEKGEKPFAAALRGAREISFTIISITLSLVAVFIPVLFMGGVVGRMFQEFAVTISLTILISGFVSLTLTPMMCSRLLKPVAHRAQHSKFYVWSESVLQGLYRGYERSLDWALRARRLMLVVTLATIAGTAWLYVVVPKGFFPTEDTGLMTAQTEAAQDISFDAMKDLQRKVADIIMADPAVSVVNSTVGSSFAGAANNGRLFIGLVPFRERDVTIEQVIERLRPQLARIPGVNVFLQPIQNIQLGGRHSKSQYQFTIQGTEMESLKAIAADFETRLAALPGLVGVTSDLELRNPEAMVDIDHDKASSLGVTAEQVRDTLYAAFGARQVATIYTSSNDYQVILEAQPRFQRSIEALSMIYVRSSNGQLVPLDAVADVERVAGPLSVNHESQLPSVTLSFDLAPGTSLGAAVESIRAVESEVALPAGVTTRFQGTAQAFEDSLAGQGLLIFAAIFVIYVVLGILYESTIHPITILSGLPAAGLGALLTLMLFDTELSVIAMIGVVMLIGIVKKNAIMMVDVAIVRRRDLNESPEAAIRQACLLRFRPITMTTMAAIMGTLPIAIGHGAGAELRQPLGLAVVGGLLVSQLLTLYITPVVYLYLERLQDRMRRRRPADSLAPAAGE